MGVQYRRAFHVGAAGVRSANFRLLKPHEVSISICERHEQNMKKGFPIEVNLLCLSILCPNIQIHPDLQYD